MASSTSKFVVDLKQEEFESEVVKKSHTTPILVDFWAPWCTPCQSLSPLLEKLAEEYAGAFLLTKINTDENPDLSLTFQVRSIPQVILFQNGKAVDQFMGVIPEPEIRRFLKPYCSNETDKLFTDSQVKLKAGKKEEARGLLEQVINREPLHSAARLALAKLLIREQQLDQAQSHLQEIAFLADERESADRLQQVIGLHENCKEAGGLSSVSITLENNSQDLSARITLASCLVASGQYRKALEEFLAVIVSDKHYRKDSARKAMLAIFSLIGERSDLAEEFRKRLARALY